MELKKLKIHDLHVKMGGKMTPFAGYEMPLKYTSELEEHKTVRSGAGIFDVSHMGEFLVEGAGALDLVQNITCNDASKLQPGQAQYSCMMNYSGGVVDDLIVYCLDEDKFMLVVNASNVEKDWHWVNKENKESVKLTNISDDICLFALQGPLAKTVLQKLTSIKLDDIKYYSFVTGEVAGINDIIVSATGYTGSGGYELFLKNEHAEAMWQAILYVGDEFDIKPIGLGARDTLRLEMGFCLYGHELTDDTSPLEAGLGWIVKMNKDFIGHEVLKKQKENGIEKKLIGFEMIDRGIPRQGYELLNEEQDVIGTVTSGSQSPSMGIGIGMGYVETAFSAVHNKLYVKVRNKLLAADIVKMPFYKKG